MIHHGDSAGRKKKAMLGCILGMNMHQIHRNPTISVPVESPFKKSIIVTGQNMVLT